LSEGSQQAKDAGQFDIRAEQQNQSWYQELATGNSKQRRNDADDESRDDANEDLRPSGGIPSGTVRTDLVFGITRDPSWRRAARSAYGRPWGGSSLSKI
jgi:hypothetical protein